MFHVMVYSYMFSQKLNIDLHKWFVNLYYSYFGSHEGVVLWQVDWSGELWESFQRFLE